LHIGIDLMGGDKPPDVLFEAIIQAAEQLDDSHSLLVIATKSVVNLLSRLELPALSAKQLSVRQRARIEFHVVADAISMGDEPLGAVRRKKGSSLVVGIRLLKKRRIDAFVSCGNTGALVASSTLSLPMLPGVSRPALLAVLPTEKGSVAVIDVGGNVSCKAHHLVQFARLGAAYQRSIQGIECPLVGLLNIGVESKKGTTEVRQAYEILKTQCQELAAKGITPRLHFLGNVEGREVFQGAVDVLVTDGFTGNVLLKTTEGVASFIFNSLQETLKDHSSEIVMNTLSDLQKHFNYAEYPGAIVCGVDGIVVKCHGNSSAKALLSSIRGAITLVKKRVITLIKEQLQ
jgi:phosphate acyltransferase